MDAQPGRAGRQPREPLRVATVDLEGMHDAGPLEQRSCEQAVGGPDLEDDVVGPHRGLPQDRREHTAVHEVVLPVASQGARPRPPIAVGRRRPGRARGACRPACLRIHAQSDAGRQKARRALAVVTAAVLCDVQPRVSATTAAVSTTHAGRFGLPR